MYDLLIKNGKIIDGTGNPWFYGDIAIQNDVIVRIGNIDDAKAKITIDAKGLFVAPGFIDAHSHSDIRILTDYKADEKVYQGITTEVIGQCGIGIAPIKDEHKEYWKESLSGIMGKYDGNWYWSSYDEYMTAIENIPKTLNVGTLVSYGAIRLNVIGNENRNATDFEIEEMKNLVKEAMKVGSLGISLGLIYVPNLFATKEEIIEVCKVVGETNKVITIHMRNEGDNLLQSIKEAIEIAEKSGSNLQISHLKIGGKENWGKTKEVFNIIENARDQGIDITFDQYPYDAASTMLKQVLPPWVQDGGDIKMIERIKEKKVREKIIKHIRNGLPELENKSLQGWDNYAKLATWSGIVITSLKTILNKRLEGMSIAEIARERGTTPIDTVCDLLVEEDAAISMAIFMMNEEDISLIMRHPLQSIGSDGLYGGKPHPRLYGSFPRVLGKYVRKEKVLTLQEAIRKMTSAPAQRYGIKDRGILKERMKADITIFDKEKVGEMSTYEKPKQFPIGIEYVVINGKIALEKGVHKSVFSGHLIRK